MAQESGVTGAPLLSLPHKVGFVIVAPIKRRICFLIFPLAYYKRLKFCGSKPKGGAQY